MEKIITPVKDVDSAEQVIENGLRLGSAFRKHVDFIHVTDPRDINHPSNVGDSKSTVTDMTADEIMEKKDSMAHDKLQGILTRQMSQVKSVPSASIVCKTGHFENILIEEGNKKENIFLVFCCHIQDNENNSISEYMDIITSSARPSMIIPSWKIPLNIDHIVYITAYHENDILVLKDIREIFKWISGSIEVLYFLDDEDYKTRVLDHNALNMLKEEIDYEYFTVKRLWSEDMNKTFRKYLDEHKPGLISFRHEKKGVINRLLRRKTIREWVLEQNHPVLIYNR
ncbi:MAG: hypothetical protein ACOCW8_00625 [bacterium]